MDILNYVTNDDGSANIEIFLTAEEIKLLAKVAIEDILNYKLTKTGIFNKLLKKGENNE